MFLVSLDWDTWTGIFGTGYLDGGSLDRGYTFLAMTFPPSLNRGTLILPRLDIIHDTRELKFRDLRTLDSFLVEGVADDVLLCFFGEFLDELVVDVFLDVDSGAGAATLT